MSAIKSLTAACILLSLQPNLSAMEIASYDSGGKLTSIIHDGAELDVTAGFRVFLDGDVVEDLQPHSQKSKIQREGYELKWMGTTEFKNGSSGSFEAEWQEHEGTLHFSGSATNPDRWPQTVKSVEYVIDVARNWFVGGHLTPNDIALPARKNAQYALLKQTLENLSLVDSDANWTLELDLDKARDVIVQDIWEKSGRFYRIRIPLTSSQWKGNEPLHIEFGLTLTGKAHAQPVKLTVNPDSTQYQFHGYGANICWGNDGPVTDYVTDRLDMVWTRHEMKLTPWDLDRTGQLPVLKEDFERIQKLQQRGSPCILSIWRIPERMYENANKENHYMHGRHMAADQWPELLDLIGSYLLHLKNEYGVEPELFSFNEPDLGVSVGWTDTGHRDAIKKIGAHLESLGLKTRMLLGDCANPNDSHRYCMPTAADPEAMKYVGAISFHSWWGATPEQYQAWSDMARWLQLPLIVGEAGLDPGSYRNRCYDSYDYGLEEAQLNLEILRYAQPQISLYWEFTSDYALCRTIEGEAVPTGRFWLMKHWTNLTPKNSAVLATTSDQEDVFIAAFKKEEQEVIHILNHGPERVATITGLGDATWTPTTTVDTVGYKESSPIQSKDGQSSIQLPARSLVTLVKSR